MLAMSGLPGLRVLPVICLIHAARYLVVVAAQLVLEALQLVVEVFVGDVTLSQRLVLFVEFLVGQRTEVAKCACNAVKNAHA